MWLTLENLTWKVNRIKGRVSIKMRAKVMQQDYSSLENAASEFQTSVYLAVTAFG